MKFFYSILFSFSIWLLALVINGCLCGLYLISIKDGWGLGIIGCVFFSLLFSIPGMLFYWLGFIVNIYLAENGRQLFRRLLNLAIVCAILPGLFVYNMLQQEFHGNGILIIFFCVTAAVATLFIHRPAILPIIQEDTLNNTVIPVPDEKNTVSHQQEQPVQMNLSNPSS